MVKTCSELGAVRGKVRPERSSPSSMGVLSSDVEVMEEEMERGGVEDGVTT